MSVFENMNLHVRDRRGHNEDFRHYSRPVATKHIAAIVQRIKEKLTPNIPAAEYSTALKDGHISP